LDKKGRIKELRKKIGLTQKEFANRIHLKGNAISMLERGASTLTEQNIELICSPSRLAPGKTVSESWLRSGEGEMFREEAGEDCMETELLDVYQQLWDENKTAVTKHAKFLLREQEETNEAKASRSADTAKKIV
jgi:transcriptional regulator with XRE-family HTH domain